MSMLNPKGFGLASGLLGGAGWLVVMGGSLLTGFLDQTVQGVGAFHPMFSYTWGGLLWMVVMHLVGGFVAGFVFAWLYNQLSK